MHDRDPRSGAFAPGDVPAGAGDACVITCALTGVLTDPRRHPVPVTPEEMAVLLQQMLAHQHGLELIRLETLGARPLGDDKQKPKIPLFTHDLVLEFRGSYLDILRYLERLESLSAGIHWDGFHLEAEEWPTNQVRLELHTLSLSEDWIGV